MTMLDANSPTFQQQYPNGAIVRDRLGRRLHGVFACNSETGEVITCDRTKLTGLWVRLQLRLPFRQWWREAVILRRHGFYPAPLTIEPRQWPKIEFDRSLSVVDDRTPEEICGYGDDGLCDH